MNTRKLPPLSQLERVEQSLLNDRLDEMLDRIEKEETAYVITENGEDKAVLCPYWWFEKSWEIFEIEVDAELLRQVEELIRPMGITMEQLIQMFLNGLVHPDTREEVIAQLLKWKEAST